MDCHPLALAIGLTTDAGPGGVAKLAARCAELEASVGVPVANASAADHAALGFGAKRVAVVTPFNAEIDQNVRANTEEAGFEVVAMNRSVFATVDKGSRHSPTSPSPDRTATRSCRSARPCRLCR